MKIINRNTIVYFLFLVFLIFIKIDYRFINEMKCCGDDFDYYSHAYTIAIDFDFDYSNQLIDGHPETYNYEGKIAPLGFVGSGLFASPFLFIGNILDTFSSNYMVENKLLIYSLSSIFYLFLTVILLFNTLKMLDKDPNILFISLVLFGSGLGYYSFERYSMTHVYEVFSISLIIFITTKIYKDSFHNHKIFISLLPLALALSFLTRFTNFYIFLIPLIIKKLFFKNKKLDLIKDKFFVVSSLFSSFIFVQIVNGIYGQFTLNPSTLYMDVSKFFNYLDEISNFRSFFVYNFDIFRTFVFSQEFGILWFNPIVLSGFIIGVLLLFKKRSFLLGILIMICYLQNFAIIGMWKSTASSYGFRYLLSLVAISIILLHSIENKKLFKFMKFYVLIFSIFGTLAILFFESNSSTELSTIYVVNSFGNEVPFSNPKYLSEVLMSFYNIDSYIKIIGSSFLMIIILKVLSIFIELDLFFTFINKNLSFNISSEIQSDFQFIESTPMYQLLIFIIFLLIISSRIVKKHAL